MNTLNVNNTVFSLSQTLLRCCWQHHLLHLGKVGVIVFTLMLMSMTAQATITGASATPSSLTLSASATNTVSISWLVTSTSSHFSGVTSSQAFYIHPTTGAVLGSASGSISASGSGPFNLPETFTVSAAQVTSWQGQGLTKVLVRRTFGDSASTTTVNAEMALIIPAAVGGLTGASVSPVQTLLSATATTTVVANWQVSTTTGHSSGAVSSAASFINASNGASLGVAAGSLTASGTGPLSLNETISISPAQVQNWQAQSISEVRLRRTFTDSASSTSATAEMSLLIPAPMPTGLTSASVAPIQATLSALNSNNLALNWSIQTASGHSTGASSNNGNFIDPTTGSVIGSVGTPLTVTGGGPFNVNETINVAPSLVQSWQAAGLTQVLLRRAFTDATTSTTVSAQVTLNVPAAAPIGLISATVTPSQSQVVAESNTTLTLTWQILAESGHTSGLSSSNASYINAANGAQLGSAGITLSATGSGPFNVIETLTLPAAQVQNWQLQGITQVLLRRVFSDPVSATTVTAESILVVPTAPVEGGLVSASGTPGQIQLSAAQLNSLNINWQVTTQAGHSSGVASLPASLQNPATGATIGSAGSSLSATGAGPFSFNEMISINQSQVQNWQTQGLERVVLKRTFTNPSPAGAGATEVDAEVTLLVPAAGGLTAASVTPSQTSLSAVSNSSVSFTWNISADSGYSAGVESVAASIMSPASGAVLGMTGSRLSATGSGPFNLNETITFTSAQVQSWQAMGLTVLTLRRVFSDAAATTQVTAEATLSLPVPGNLSGARVSPPSHQAYASQDSMIMANWQVNAGADHRNGVVSQSATAKNPRTGATLAEVAGVLSASGSGPYFFNETLSLDDSLLQSWLSQGLTRIVIERAFTDPIGGSKTMASIVITISSSPLTAAREATDGGLLVQGLRLEFNNGSNLALADINSALTARLTLNYSGMGLLQGAWQVAEAGSTEALPFYRTLELVRQNLVGNQRATLESPVLPTSRSGKYLIRFCVTSPTLTDSNANSVSAQCSADQLLVNGSYQVQAAGAATAKIMVLSPSQQTITEKTPFSWQAVAEARLYRIQIYEKQPGQASLASAIDQAEMYVPAFVSGQMLPANITSTSLSELVRSKLEPGRLYQWRVTAHDKAGKVVASSSLFNFVYQPQEL